MIAPNPSQKTIKTFSVMPQVLHRNIISRRDGINRLIHGTFVMSEILLVLGIFVGLYFYRLSQEFNIHLFQAHGISLTLPRLGMYALFLASFSIIWLILLYQYRILTYRKEGTVSVFNEILFSIKSISYAVLITVGIAFLLKIEDLSRLIIIAFWLGGIVATVSVRGLKKLLIYQLSKKGLLATNVVIVGAGQIGQQIYHEFMKQRALGYQVVGFIDDNRKKSSDNQLKIIGKLEDMEKIIKNYLVDEIIITIPSERKMINQFLNRFRKFDITIKVVPEMFNLMSKTIEVEQINAIPFVTLIKTPMQGIPLMIKRIIDYLGAFLLTLMLSPLFITVALLIKLDSKGPIFFKQRRVGINGKFFHMYKFRSMVQDAEQLKHRLSTQNEVEGNAFKIKGDPRITRVGRFIRKYSIDELPQIFNVLLGHMSLVGPRPPLPREVEEYTDWEWRRLEVVPGITGLWQVSGRSELSFDQWVNLDVYYIENWNLWLDLKILIKTLPVVIKGEGAY